MNSTDKAVVCISVSALLLLAVVTVCMAIYETTVARDAIKAGLEQSPSGRWVKPSQLNRGS